jgi:dUTP pyrophosphatase
MKIKVVNKSNNELPSYQTSGSAGMDVRAWIESPMGEVPMIIRLKPMERKMIQTGLYFEIPEGYELQIRPRSGLAIKNGITIINTPGTLDSDYRGELCILLVNLSNEIFEINNGDRIAQILIKQYEIAEWEQVETLSNNTERGKGGFNSTGIK